MSGVRWVILWVALAMVQQTGRCEDWPQWRGPNRDGVWRESGLVREFEEDRLPLKWSVEVGPGYNGPTVANGRVYVMDRQTDPKEVERVLCFDAASGAPVWSHSYDCRYEVDYPLGPRASVTIENGLAYSLGTMGHLHCLDAITGEVLYQKDLKSEYAIDLPIWGLAASPLLYGDYLILHIGGTPDACVIALDKKTGMEKWRSLSEKASYSSPILIEQAGKDLLVVWTGESLTGLNPQDGTVAWTQAFKPSRMVLNVATPVYREPYLFVSAFYDGSMLVKLSETSLETTQVWRRAGKNERNTDSLHSIIGTPYLKGDSIYGTDSYGELRCLDLLTGDRIWEDLSAVANVRWGTIHFVENEDRVLMFNEHGDLLIGRLSREGFTETDRTHVIDPTSDPRGREGKVAWSHPAFANQCIYARNDERLVCGSLAAE